MVSQPNEDPEAESYDPITLLPLLFNLLEKLILKLLQLVIQKYKIVPPDQFDFSHLVEKMFKILFPILLARRWVSSPSLALRPYTKKSNVGFGNIIIPY